MNTEGAKRHESRPELNGRCLELDTQATIELFVDQIRKDILKTLKKQGGVIGVSGGIDSSVTLGLLAKALPKDKILALALPEQDSSSDSLDLAQELCEHFGVKLIKEALQPGLAGLGCYSRRDEAIKEVFPEYSPETHKAKIVMPSNVLEADQLPFFNLTVIDSSGHSETKRLKHQQYLQIVAATNFKQRTRMSMLYYHAERLNFAVVGTPNKHEHQQGFFVKHGDAGVDLMPIVNLYKGQVYQLAEALGVPEEIRKRPPTSDTYSAESTQEEFFFQLDFKLLDLLWYGFENGYSEETIARVCNLEPLQVKRAVGLFTRKINTTEYLRTPPLRDYQPILVD